MIEVISIQKTNQLKSVAILMMLCLHLFNKDYHGLFTPLIFIGIQPLSYYISLFSDACVPIFAFVSGYGLYYSYLNNNGKNYLYKNNERLKQLYLRYWIILILFVVILGLIVDKEGYPGNWQKFILTFTGINPAYNGAWWFFTIYVLFVLSSRTWFQLLEKINPIIYFTGLLLIYLIAFYYREYKFKIFEDPILNWAHTQVALYFCTLFQFMLGAFALKYHWHHKIGSVFKNFKYSNITAYLGIIILMIVHGLFPNFIIAPFTALGFIFFFLQMKFGKLVEKSLDFFTPHSTNLWLVHMFFYLIFFKEIIYAPQYPLLIFVWLVLCSLLASYIINLIYIKVYSFIK